MATNLLQYGDPYGTSDNPLAQAPTPSYDPAAATQPDTGTPTLGAAASSGVDALGQWLAAQRAKSVQMGLMDPTSGWPTRAGIVDAAGQTANALLMGTTAPGARGVPLDNPAFAQWFGKSKVVDESGQPLVVYHGSGADIPQFDTSRGAQTTGNVTAPWGAYFTPSPGEASRYATDFHATGQNITPVHLAIENPYEMPRSEWDKHAMTVFRGQMTQDEAMQAASDFKAQLQDAGHDGIVIKGRGFNNEYVAFNPEQIKSAVGNRGTFDLHDPRIAYGLAGLIAGGGAAAAATQQQQPSQ